MYNLIITLENKNTQCNMKLTNYELKKDKDLTSPLLEETIKPLGYCIENTETGEVECF